MISDNLRRIEQEIQSSCALSFRSVDEVTLVAVTKYSNEESMATLYELGGRHFAENRVEPFLNKKAYFVKETDICWHFIGNLQRRKVKSVINEIDYFHALDSWKLAVEIQKRATKTIRCFVEVNVSGEEAKHGLALDEVVPFIRSLAELPQIEVVGLMTMAPFTADEQEQRQIFSQLKQLQTVVVAEKLSHAPCQELSMGMSRDFSNAILEGATFVRIGTALMGNDERRGSDGN